MANEEKTPILMIDDSEDDFVLIRDMIEEAVPGKYEMSWASSFAKGLKMAAESTYAVAFLDYRLGDGDGLKFLKEASAKSFKIPIVFLTGKGNYWVGVEAIRRGVSDFLVKGEVTPALLERAILHAIERKRMIMALTASEEKFRAVFEDSGTSIAITDLDGLISDTNSCFQDMFGARADAINGKQLASLVYPEDGRLVSCAFEKLANGAGSCTSAENRYVGNGGKVIWGKTLLSSIAGEDGNAHKVVVMISDITKEKLAEERIAELARFPEQNPFPVLRVGADGVVTYANKGSAPVLSKWGVAIGGKAPADVMLNCASALASNLLNEIEVDCGDVVFSMALSPVPEIGYINVYGRDITDWKRATSRLQLAAKVYESAMDGILITDVDGVILSVNPAFTNITGYSAVEAIGKKPSILKSGRHEAEFYREMWEQLRDKGYWKGEIWNRRKNGETYPQGVNIASVTDDHGQIIQYVGVFQDITDMKERQKDMSYYAHHDPLTGLPNRVLFDDRLRHAINRARRDNKKGAIVYVDLDGFKEINDTHGHNVGDMVLQGVAVRLTSTLRVEDTISRFGGDEFIILLEHAGHKRGLKVVVEKILTAIQESFLFKGSEINVGASVGVAMFPFEMQDSETLIKNADVAMYAAKQEGKNRVMFYGDMKKKQGSGAGPSGCD